MDKVRERNKSRALSRRPLINKEIRIITKSLAKRLKIVETDLNYKKDKKNDTYNKTNNYKKEDPKTKNLKILKLNLKPENFKK